MNYNILKQLEDLLSNDIDSSISFDQFLLEKQLKEDLEHISKALEDGNWRVRTNAIQHPKATKEHIDKALEDENWSVRYNAIQHPKATKEHIDKALEDEDDIVRWAAKQRLNTQKS